VKNKFLYKEKKRLEMSNITNKVVVITGASSGIGESTAKLLAEQGAKVVLGARRSNRIDAVVQEISAAGGKAIGFATDVTKRAEVEALVQGAVNGFGRVDVLLNNAGIMPIAPIEALKVDEWDRQIDVNIKGLLYGVAAALPHMQKQKSGHIINMASVFGIKVFAPGGTVYCSTKAAVRADRRAADGTALPKYPLHHDLTWRDCHRTVGEQLGRSDQKEFARVHENGDPGQRDRESDRLRNRAAS
jgi:NADP-dependent 3-hydroxy acid dehydrogenase YdfG